MPNIRRPRRGSMQFWPRCRASRPYAKIYNWAAVKDVKVLAFAGYKAGMTHVMLDDQNPKSMTKGESIFCPVTVIECPPLKPYSVRFYKKTDNGFMLISEVLAKNIDKNVLRKTTPSKKEAKEPEHYDMIRLVVYTQPWLVGLKKTPEIFEIAIGGKDVKEQAGFAQALLTKEIKISDVFKENQMVDTHSVSKAKGTQGPVKRFGVHIRQHKAEKTKRGPASLGSWHPNRVDFRVAHAGKMGFHQRTEYNKVLLKIGNNPKDIAVKGGFLNYGIVKNDFVILKGSVAGTRKRLITFTEPVRQRRTFQYGIDSISLSSKQ